MLIQVAVCSPVPALRAGLAALIDGDPGLTVWAAAAALEALPVPLPAGLVILSDAGGLDLPPLKASEPEDAAWGELLPRGAALLLIAAEPLADLLDDAHRQVLTGADLRAWGAISPDASAESLCAAVRALAEGLSVFSPDLLPAAGTLLGARRGAAPDGDALDALSEREIEVLRRLAEGLTNKQAALALGISEHTVKFHVSAIYSKLGVMNRAEAVREGARRGLIPL